jgi:ABC-type cobalamin transport system ATPase subunit
MVCSSFSASALHHASQMPSIAARLSAVAHVAKHLQNLSVFRKAAGAMLRIDERAVGTDVEYPGASLDELRLDAELTRNIGRQTGGPWQIVSLAAVPDADAHIRAPRNDQ